MWGGPLREETWVASGAVLHGRICTQTGRSVYAFCQLNNGILSTVGACTQGGLRRSVAWDESLTTAAVWEPSPEGPYARGVRLTDS